MAEQELTQRDLLIKIGTEMAEFKKYTKESFDRLEESITGLLYLKTELARIDERVKENTRMRIWIYGALANSLLSTIIGMSALYNVLK